MISACIDIILFMLGFLIHSSSSTNSFNQKFNHGSFIFILLRAFFHHLRRSKPQAISGLEEDIDLQAKSDDPAGVKCTTDASTIDIADEVMEDEQASRLVRKKPKYLLIEYR